MHFWKYVRESLTQHKKLAVLYVLDSKGSSPGRQGFKMMVSENGDMRGSIGGGIMEHKLVELAKSKLHKEDFQLIFRKQLHSKSANNNQSGMICSGEQSVVILFLRENDLLSIDQLCLSQQKGNAGTIIFTPRGLEFAPVKPMQTFAYEFINEDNWKFQESSGFKKYAYIIGGGHVSHALTRVLVDLEFHCTVIDDRDKLNTLTENNSAQRKLEIPYAQLSQEIPEGEDIYIFIMTFGYRSDLDVLQQIVNKKVAYKGMMGSEEKIQQLMGEMKDLGYTDDQLQSIHSPIGIPIKSRTPSEIAISIAAQIIQIQNKDLP